MAGFEDLIRGALAKQGDPSPEQRQGIYASARQALQRMVDGNASMSEDVAQLQRQRLETAIEEIEADYTPAPAVPPADEAESGAPQTPEPPIPMHPSTPPEPVVVDQPRDDTPVSTSDTSSAADVAPPIPLVADPVTANAAVPPPAKADRVEPSLFGEPTPEVDPVSLAAEPKPTAGPGRVEPSLDGEPSAPPPLRLRDEPRIGSQHIEPPAPSVAADEPVVTSPMEDGITVQEKRPYARLLLWAIILAAIGVSIWWAITFGAALIRSQLDGSVPNPQPTLESGSFDPSGESQEGWITVFTPDASAQNVVTSGSGAAALQQEGSQPIMRLASPDGTIGNNLLVKVPRGLMESLRGKAATFELVIKAPSSASQEFTIFCEFGALGNCGRKRFTATDEVEPFLFDVLINNDRLPSDEDAYLSINTDLAGSGRALDLYSIRVRSD